MACNTGYVTDEEALVYQGALVSVAETPNLQDGSTVYSKKRHTESPLPPFDNPGNSPDHCPAPLLGMTVGSEIKKLIVSNCCSIVKLEASLNKLEARSTALEQHRIDGTIPKDLLLPKKKSLFEDHQPQVDEILQTVMNSLLLLRIKELSRKMSDLKSRKASLEKDVLITLKSSRDTQLSLVSCDEESVAIINSRYSLNVHSFYSQLAIAREKAFLKVKREAEKEAKKKRDVATPMDVAPDARVIDVLDQRLKQLGLIGKKSRSRSDSSNSRSSAASQSSCRSRSQSTSPASSRGLSTSRIPSRSSSRKSRGHSRSILRQKKSPGAKKSVKFESQVPKNGGPTTSHQRGKRRGPGRGNR